MVQLSIIIYLLPILISSYYSSSLTLFLSLSSSLYPAPTKSKASTALKATKKGVQQTRSVAPRKSVHFYRPKTLTLQRKPKYEKKAIHLTLADDYAVLLHPLCSESAMKQMETNNTLVFIVSHKSNKFSIKKAASSLYGMKVKKVNTLITPMGVKKAYIRLSPEQEALEVADTIGII
jgi:large subunit ribosomal protein L23Ae